jgi:hypothetical protein
MVVAAALTATHWPTAVHLVTAIYPISDINKYQLMALSL